MKIGTLKELDAKPNDVVELVWNGIYNSHWSERGTINKKGAFPGRGDDSGHKYRIVSRASDPAKTWGEMTDDERRDISFSAMNGEEIEIYTYIGWAPWDRKTPLCETLLPLRVKPATKRITVDLTADFKVIGTIDLVDGEPDWDSLKRDQL